MSDVRPVIRNVLAERYASKMMLEIWSRENKIRLERRLWIEIMRAQRRHGVAISEEMIAQYESFIDQIDLESIDRREKELRHDVKARIEEFNEIAGLQAIHLGLTSRDLTENVELLQVKMALALIRDESIAVLKLLAGKIAEYSDLTMVGRSHNVPAQLTTLGKRFATIAEEFLFAFERLDSLIERLPLKGLRGPVGTAQDLVDLVGVDAAYEIEDELRASLGFTRILHSTGQIYPRSIDFEIVSTLVQLSAAPSSFAVTMRLMAGAGLVSEGFNRGQVGSSAMPHKVNARSCERINGLAVLLKGYLTMINEITGEQWNEGDVSCSVVRRVALPDGFLALDGLLRTFATILKEMQVFEERIRDEVQFHLPLVSSTRILMAAVKKGMGREDAHRKIQSYSLDYLAARDQGREFDFVKILADDGGFPLQHDEIQACMRVEQDMGSLRSQINRVSERIKKLPESPFTSDGTFTSIV